MGIWQDEAAAARPLNPIHTCHSASQLSSSLRARPPGAAACKHSGSTKGPSGFPTNSPWRSGP